jgi:hypothetical protein
LSPNLEAGCPISKLGISKLKMEGLSILFAIWMLMTKAIATIYHRTPAPLIQFKVMVWITINDNILPP